MVQLRPGCHAESFSRPPQVYTLLWEALTGQHCAPAKAAAHLERRYSPPAALKKEPKKTSKREKEPLVLVLDELDYLVTRTQSVIYSLFEWATNGHAALIVVGISNTMDLPERLLPRVHSRLGIRRINFLTYSRTDIELIIADRLGELAAFSGSCVELCARKVASVSGDVRRALEMCRLAAQVPSLCVNGMLLLWRRPAVLVLYAWHCLPHRSLNQRSYVHLPRPIQRAPRRRRAR